MSETPRVMDGELRLTQAFLSETHTPILFVFHIVARYSG